MALSTSGYTPELVTQLLPYLWEEYLPNGVGNPNRADPDMPKGSRDTSHGGTWMAMLADLRIAWEEPILTGTERRRVLHWALLDGAVTDGPGNTAGPASFVSQAEGVDPSTVRGSVHSASSKLAAYMNNETYEEEEIVYAA